MRGSVCIKVILAVALSVSAFNVSAFNLQKRSAETINFDQLVGDGRWTLVMLWAIDCVPCEQQKPMIDAFHTRHVDTKARVIGVALDGIDMIDGINKVIRRTPTRFPTYIANPADFYDAYRIRTNEAFRATPTYLLFDPTGTYAGTHVGSITRDALERVIGGA